jgi:uncharacterized protein YdhG (YjbR/CyaY superfamily)
MATNKGFSAEERAAMKERAAELKAQKTKEDGERAVQQAIAKLPEPDRTMAAKVHEIVTKAAPDLAPRTWYGMPAYARNDKVVCFFKAASKFKSRYAVLGFSDEASLDDGAMWPTDYAVLKLTGPVEKQIRALVKQAVS